MMNKKTAAQGFGAALATPLAVGATAVAYKAQLHVLLILMIFIVVWVGLFKTVVWTFMRKLPVTSAEHRRRNRKFYDWLRSQGRR
jgi:dipeptide/tripeptide permease